MSTFGTESAISPISSINAYSNQMPIEQPNFSSFSNRRASMPPIQVVYGKPVPLETQSEQRISQPPSSSSSSLPLFLQGAPDDIIDEYKTIIRKPNSNYDQQKLYREFMQENDEREQVHRDKIHKNVEEMSTKAQEQFAKISALLRNQELPNEERWARVLSFYGKMDPTLRSEFEDKFKDFGSNQQ
ncbi:hypothetical protein M3Y97_00604200 [Aphelenchoides bicaudatus]|nr:hypothetical protein M3Y97_00604200 [Aphelenchoides bicaudatus]